MTRDQIQKRIEMIIEEEFFKYQDSHSVQRSAKRIMKEWDNGFAYELKSDSSWDYGVQGQIDKQPWKDEWGNPR